MKKNTTKLLNNKGMSFVEVLVVIAIIVVIAGALTPALIKYIEHSRQSKDIKMIDNVRDSMQFALAEEKIADSVAKGPNSFYQTPHEVIDLFDSSQAGYSQDLDAELRSLLSIPTNASLSEIKNILSPSSKVTRDSTGTPYPFWFYIDNDDSVSTWIGTNTAAIHAKVTDRMFLGGSKDLNISGWNQNGIQQ
ncbi:MAG: prepilin-type N-terminal cleavage/methylation domain-containing protein [Lachnospiraceae bacterium]|nr:prepilin-type N-terminal cleavage/methylation domain-containing protein [Lachnospiraceae bacterium]